MMEYVPTQGTDEKCNKPNTALGANPDSDVPVDRAVRQPTKRL